MSYKTTLNCLKCSLLALGLLLFQAGFTQEGFADLDQAIQARKKELGKAFVLQVWKAGDTLVYTKSFGEMMTPKTSVPMMRSSQWLTAALVMMFVDEGKLSLDDKITRWLPEFEKYGKNYITIGHCLTHMTGIKMDNAGVGQVFTKKQFSSLEDEVNSYAAREILTNPGTEFRYSEAGINIAGRVLEVVSKKKFDQLIKQRLLTPLKMRNTSFSNLSGGAVNPSTGAMSTADDYMKFLVMLMNKGSYHGRQVLSQSSVELMTQVQAKAEVMKNVPKSASGFSYGLGTWIVNKDLGDKQATIVAGPGLYSNWPMIDLCRGYAYLFVVKDRLDDDNGNLHLQLKSVIDTHFKGGCKE